MLTIFPATPFGKGADGSHSVLLPVREQSAQFLRLLLQRRGERSIGRSGEKFVRFNQSGSRVALVAYECAFHEMEIYIKTTPERLWQAITDPEMRRKYSFGVAVHSDWKRGSSYTATAGDATASPMPISEGENLEVDPPRRLVQTFRALWSEDVKREGTSRVTWEIEQIEDSCRLTVVHDQLDTRKQHYEPRTSQASSSAELRLVCSLQYEPTTTVVIADDGRFSRENVLNAVVI